MANKRVKILIAEPSTIIRVGLSSIIIDFEAIGANIAETENVIFLEAKIDELQPDIVVVNPSHIGVAMHQNLVKEYSNIKFVALYSALLGADQLSGYDATISVLDSVENIEKTFIKLIDVDENEETQLSQREKEIISAIARGKSNKEIADYLFISIHTVTTHRRNIASKLKIHNPAGLTIYAIANRLIDVSEIQ